MEEVLTSDHGRLRGRLLELDLHVLGDERDVRRAAEDVEDARPDVAQQQLVAQQPHQRRRESWRHEMTTTRDQRFSTQDPGVAWKNIGVAVGSACSSPDWPITSTPWDHK